MLKTLPNSDLILSPKALATNIDYKTNCVSKRVPVLIKERLIEKRGHRLCGNHRVRPSVLADGEDAEELYGLVDAENESELEVAE